MNRRSTAGIAMVEAGGFKAMEPRHRSSSSSRHSSVANPHCCHRRFLAAIFLLVSQTLLQVVHGAPILGPDLTTCTPVRVPFEGIANDMVECCLLDRPTKEFQFPTHLPMRVRRPVHTLDEKFVQQFERGIALMRALPDDDPRSWFQQYKLHCAYTSNVYKQLGEFPTDHYISVHFNYLFLPFHRWFTFFQERILATLLGDDSFAIPYWAWELQHQPLAEPKINVIPLIFTNESSPLYDPNRSRVHAYPNRVDLLLQTAPYNQELKVLAASNYYQMWRVMKGESAVPEVFFGSKLGLGDENVMAGGPFEMGPHTGVHTWVGDERCPASEDMAQPYVSARDPLFSVHHSQVDRVWKMWKDFGHRDLDDPDFLNSEFLFFDEHGDRVRVSVAGCLDLEKLRISYEQVEVDWPERRDPPVISIRARGDARYAPVTAWDNAWRQIVDTFHFSTFGGLFWKSSEMMGRILSAGGRGGGGVVTARIPRPSLSWREVKIRRNGGDGFSSDSEFDEVLVVRGQVTKPFHVKVIFNVFVELPEAKLSTPLDCLESTGQIYIEPSRSLGEGAIVTRKFLYKTGIGGKFERLGIDRRRSVAVSFVPAWDAQYDAEISVRFTELRMEWHVIE